MLSYVLAEVDQYDEFFQLMRIHAADYLNQTMGIMGLNWQQFEQLFRTVGQIYAIHESDQLAGFCWIEERGNILHLRELILKKGFQGKGIGTQVLQMLEDKYVGQIVTIQLGVHRSNERAIARTDL